MHPSQAFYERNWLFGEIRDRVMIGQWQVPQQMITDLLGGLAWARRRYHLEPANALLRRVIDDFDALSRELLTVRDEQANFMLIGDLMANLDGSIDAYQAIEGGLQVLERQMPEELAAQRQRIHEREIAPLGRTKQPDPGESFSPSSP